VTLEHRPIDVAGVGETIGVVTRFGFLEVGVPECAEFADLEEIPGLGGFGPGGVDLSIACG